MTSSREQTGQRRRIGSAATSAQSATSLPGASEREIKTIVHWEALPGFSSGKNRTQAEPSPPLLISTESISNPCKHERIGRLTGPLTILDFPPIVNTRASQLRMESPEERPKSRQFREAGAADCRAVSPAYHVALLAQNAARSVSTSCLLGAGA